MICTVSFLPAGLAVILSGMCLTSLLPCFGTLDWGREQSWVVFTNLSFECVHRDTHPLSLS